MVQRGGNLSNNGLDTDFGATVRVLVEIGEYDLSFSNKIGGFNLAQLYCGPTALFRWLQQQSITPFFDFDHDFERSMEAIMQPNRRPHRGQLIKEVLPNSHLGPRVFNYQNLSGETFLFYLTISWIETIGKCQKETFETLIKAAVTGGADLHALRESRDYGTGYMIRGNIFLWLVNFTFMGSGTTYHRITRCVRSWLHILLGCGVSLLTFWEEEFRLYNSGTVSWTFEYEVRTSYYKPDYRDYDMQILNISYGERAEDFDVIFEDAYVSGNFLPYFWEFTERGEQGEHQALKMPGSWEDY